MNKENLENLPLEIQEKVKAVLSAYDKVSVIFEYGKYNVSTGVCLKNNYAIDFKIIGEYTKDEIYTKEEQQINYIENFLSFPMSYKGSKDWNMIKQLEKLKSEGQQGKIKFNDEGNFYISEIIDIKR